MHKTLLPWLLLTSSVVAQRVPDPVDNAREIHVHDLRAALAARANLAKLDADAWRANLLTTVRGLVRPALASEAHLQLLGHDLLVLRGAPEQQADLARLLRSLESPRGKETIRIESRLWRVPQAEFARSIAPLLGLGPELGKVEGGGATEACLALDPRRAEAFTKVLGTAAKGDVLRRFGVDTLPCWRWAERGEIIRYVKDYDVEIASASFVATPISGELFDGLHLDVRAVPLGDDGVGIVTRGRFTAVKRPIRKFETKVSNKDIEIDLPEWTDHHLDGELRLEPGGAGVIVTGTAKDTHRLVLTLRAVVR